MRLMWSHPLGRVVTRPGSDDGPAAMIMMLDFEVQAERAHDREAIVALGRAIERLDCEQLLAVRAVRRSPKGRIIVESDVANGSPLSSLLDAGPLAIERAVGILRQVAHGLAVAHAGGVMHGALSLASVIVDGDRGDVVRLADFGLGRLSWEAVERFAATQPISPERVLGLVPTPAEDVYMFGCIAYTVLAGRAPFEDGAAADVRRRHAIEDAPNLADTARGREIPPAIAAVVMRCLAKEYEDRHADGSGLEIAWCKAQLEAGIATRWDDLPLPTMAQGAREALSRGLAALASPQQPAAAAPVRRPPPPAAPRPSTPPPRRRSLPPRPKPVEASMPSSTAASAVLPAATETDTDTEPEADTAPSRPAPTEVTALDEQRPTPQIEVTAPRPGSRRWVALVGGLVGLVGLGIVGFVVMDPLDSAAPPSVAATPSSPSAARPPRAADADDVVPPPDEPEVPAEPEAAVIEPEVPAEPEAVILEPEVETTEGRKDATRPAARDTRPADTAKPEGGDPAEPKSDVTDLMQRAKQARDAGQKGAAEALYQQVLARQPRHKGALSALGELAFGKGDAAAAAKYFARATKVSPKDADLRIQLGDALFKLGRYEKARTEFAKAAASGHPSAIRRLQIVDAKLAR